MYCNIIITVVALLYYLNEFEVVMGYIMFWVVVLLISLIIWLLIILDAKKSNIVRLNKLLFSKEAQINHLNLRNSTMSDIEYSNLKDSLKSKDVKIKTLQFKIDLLERGGVDSLGNLTPKDIKLIKQYLHPDKHNGKSSEIYTKVVGLLSKDG